MSLTDRMQAGVSRLCRPTTGLGEATIRQYQKLTHAGVNSGDPIDANTVLHFPSANVARGIQTGATVLVIDGKPFDDAGVDLKDGEWKALAAGGASVDLELTGLVSGDPKVGYEVVINPKGARSAA